MSDEITTNSASEWIEKGDPESEVMRVGIVFGLDEYRWCSDSTVRTMSPGEVNENIPREVSSGSRVSR